MRLNLSSLPSLRPAAELEALRTERARREAEARAAFLQREAATLEERLEQIRTVQAGPGGLLEFVRYFWDVLEPGKGFVDGWPLEAICLHLEAVTDGTIRRLLINVPPGFAKSLLVDVFWPAWEWTACGLSHMRFLSFSYAPEITQRDNGKFLALLQSPRMQELYGATFELTERSRYKVGNTQFGSKIASSVGGVSTGERADRVMLDDPHNVKDAESQLVREATVRWFQESMQNRLNDLGESAIVVIMQRVHEADVSGVIIERFPSYVHLCITMDYEERRHCETFTATGELLWSDPRAVEGELAFPERFPEDSLAPFRMLRTLWATQYQQSPAPRGGGILKRDDWKLWDVEDARRMGLPIGKKPDPERPGEMIEVPPFPVMKYIVASLDTAYTEKQQNDPCALTVWGVWQNAEGLDRIMLITAWATRYELHPLVQQTIKSCKRWRPDVLLIENKAAGHSVAQEVRRLASEEDAWVVRMWDPGRGDKVSRAYAVQPMFEAGLVYAPDRTWAEMVINECATFPQSKFDDLVDTTTQALAFLRSIGMAQLPQETMAQLERELSNWKKPKPLYPV